MDFGAFLANLIPTLGLAALAVLAHLAYKHRWAWWLYKVLLWLYVGLVGVLSVMMGGVWYMAAKKPEILQKSAGASSLTAENLPGLFWGGLCITLFSMLVLLPWTRRWIFRAFPGSPDSPPHEMGAVFFISVLTGFLLFLLFFFDLEAMLPQLQKMNLLEGVVTFLVLQIVIVVAGAGTFVSRSVPEAVVRLGITPVSREVALKMVGLGLLAFIAVFFGGEVLLRPFMDPALQKLEHAMKPPGEFPLSLLSGFAIALGAGIGEELFFRGLLQPVFGLFPTAALFAVIHFHYGLTPLMLMVFLLGCLFGWIRKRYNTTAAIIAHASYDLFALLVTAILGFINQ